MQIFLDIIRHGKIKIELSVHEHNGCSVIFTVTDEDDRRILKSEIMHEGKVKIYSNAQDAIKDAIMKLTAPAEQVAHLSETRGTDADDS
jgi:hypothetical protein